MPTKKRIGVVIGRFQTPYLHDGHIELLNYVKRHNDIIVVMVGCTVSKQTTNNPLDYGTRELMITEKYPEAIMRPIWDSKSDKSWSRNVDFLVTQICKTYDTTEVVIYGGRDSFIPHYSGEYRTEEIKVGLHAASATHLRKAVSKMAIGSMDFRKGVIYGAFDKYPRVFPTVDIVPCDYIRNKVLLGRKTGEAKFRFIGGFADPTDKNFEEAALRELGEEVPNIVIIDTDVCHLGSFKIKDWRLAKEEDSIITSFYEVLAEYQPGLKAGDDLEEVRWFDFEHLTEDTVEPEHAPLMKCLVKHLQ